MTEIERKEIFEIVNTEIAKIEEKIEDLKTFTSPISPMMPSGVYRAWMQSTTKASMMQVCETLKTG
ncbi:MAG: hypothetical protein U5Q03_18690 [Bacteroidota bacterium]|nr:hypothetical protein [Bacteroidota bacterium]